MRVRRLQIRKFGPLVERDLESPSDAVVVFGPNMAGKSSFRDALETLFYGFEPARRDAHPLWLWDEGDDLHLEGDLEPRDGAPFRIERTLQTTGKQRRAGAGEAFAGARQGNGVLPEAAHGSRAMYRAVYGLTLDDLRTFDDELSEDIDHLLLPPQQGVQLRPSRDVIRKLAAEHAAIWHRDRRRGQRARGLQDEHKKLRAELKSALERQEQLRGARAELETIAARLPLLVEERGRLLLEAEEAELARKIFDWRYRSARLPEPPDLSRLEGRPLDNPRSLEDRIEELERECEPFRNRLERDPVELDEATKRVLERAEAIEAIETGLHEDQTKTLEEQSGAREDLRERLLDGLGGVLSGRATAKHLDALRGVSHDRILGAADEWAAALERETTRAGHRTLALGLLVVGVSAMVAGVAFDGLWWLTVVGGGLTLAGGLVLWRTLARHSVGRSPEDAVRSLSGAFGNLPVEPAAIDSPQTAHRTGERLRQLRERFADLDELDRSVKSRSEVVAGRESEWRAMLEELDLEPVGQGVAWARQLEGALDSARIAERNVAEDLHEREVATIELRAREPRLAELQEHLASVLAVLTDAVPEAADAGEAFDSLQDRGEKRRRLRHEGEALRDEPRFERLLAELPEDPSTEPDEAPWREDIVERRQGRIAEIESTRDELLPRRGGLETQLRDDPGSDAAAVQERVKQIDEAMIEARVERDRLALLERLLTEADRRYREAHQPDVLRNANRYLERVTGGTMTGLEYGDGGENRLLVTPAGRDEPVPVDAPLSRGTRDQIHLCLRLGLLDHLDRDNEPLPLVLDEVLVNWDAARRAEVYPLLREVAKRRQLFLLTCHEAFAEEARQALDATRVDL